MRALAAMLISLAGLATSGAAYVRSNGPVRPASPWSLSERLGAMRIDRTLPPAVRKQASFSLHGEHAVLKVREPSGPVLLRCSRHVDIADAFVSYAANGTPPGCETQAVDEAGDLLVYEVGGRVAPLCPGQYATLTEQQLHDALFLPALQLGADAPMAVLQPGKLDACAPGESNCALARSAGALLYCGEMRTCADGACLQGGKDVQPDDVATSLYYYQALAQARTPSSVAPPACGAVPMSVHMSTLISEVVTATTASRFAEAQPWNAATLAAPGSAETAADLRAFFDKHRRGVCLFMRGVDLDRPQDVEMVAQTLAFPVFAPYDPRAPSRATPLLRSLQRATADDALLSSLLWRCDLTSDRACRLKRERIAAQLRASVGGLQPGLGNLTSDEIPYHIGASGAFHLSDYDLLHVTLESATEVPKAKGTKSKLTISYQPLWPESVADKRLQCQQQPGICIFRALWRMDAGRTRVQEIAGDGFESLVALFARRDANTRCVRRLFNALASSGEDRLLELQRDVRDAVGAGENRAPCDPRARGPASLVPHGEDAAGCTVRAPSRPFGDVAEDGCRSVSLVYVQEEPWAGAAARIASIASSRGVAVTVSGIKASEVHRGPLGSWDVLLTVASNYYNRNYPTLVPLLHPSGNQNLSGGQAVSETPGRALLTGYEASIVFPPPAWLGAPSGTPATRAESLRLLEEDVAKNGPAPIFPLAFLQPGTLAIPESQAEPARSPWYFAHVLQAWSAQP